MPRSHTLKTVHRTLVIFWLGCSGFSTTFLPFAIKRWLDPGDHAKE